MTTYRLRRPLGGEYWRGKIALGHRLAGPHRGMEGIALQIGLALAAAALQLAPYAWPGPGIVPGFLAFIPITGAAALNPELAIVATVVATYLVGTVSTPAAFTFCLGHAIFAWTLGSCWHAGYSRRRAYLAASAVLWLGLLMLTYGVAGIPSFDALKGLAPLAVVPVELVAALAWAGLWFAALDAGATAIVRSAEPEKIQLPD